jgi:hypothetical protein
MLLLPVIVSAKGDLEFGCGFAAELVAHFSGLHGGGIAVVAEHIASFRFCEKLPAMPFFFFGGGDTGRREVFYPQIAQIIADFFWVGFWRGLSFFIRRLRRLSQIFFGWAFGEG